MNGRGDFDSFPLFLGLAMALLVAVSGLGIFLNHIEEMSRLEIERAKLDAGVCR